MSLERCQSEDGSGPAPRALYLGACLRWCCWVRRFRGGPGAGHVSACPHLPLPRQQTEGAEEVGATRSFVFVARVVRCFCSLETSQNLAAYTSRLDTATWANAALTLFPVGPTARGRRSGLVRCWPHRAALPLGGSGSGLGRGPRKALSGRGAPSLPSPWLQPHLHAPRPSQGPRGPTRRKPSEGLGGGQGTALSSAARPPRSSGRQRAHWAPKCHVASDQDTDQERV